MARPAQTSRGSQHRSSSRGKAVVDKMQHKQAKVKARVSQYGLVGVTLLVLVGAVIVTTWDGGFRPDSLSSTGSGASIELVHHAYTTDGPRSLDALLELPDEELAQLDIAVMNLICAEGLPGAESIDIDSAIILLDQWAATAEAFTQQHMYRLTDPRYLDRWGGSEARFRTEMLLQVLQEDCGVAYNEASKFDVDFSRSKHLFIHGMMPDEDGQVNGGTCVSMPVIYAAVGRRLGYPIHLTTTAAHVFCRWEGAGHDTPAWRERFNIEGSGEGFAAYSDDYYMTWPKEVTPEQLAAFNFLETLTPRQELAMFLAARGHNLVANEKLHEAAAVFGHAMAYHPETRLYEFFQKDVQRHLAWLTRQENQSRLATVEAEFAEIERINRENMAWMEQQHRGPQDGFQQQPSSGPPLGIQPIQPGYQGQSAYDPYR